MSVPDSLTSCMDPSSMSLKDYMSKTADLAKATGMDQQCQKAAQTEADAAAISASASIPFAEVSAQASFQHSSTAMQESGCGQFALNAQKQLNEMKNINCTVKSTNNSVNAQQVSGNSLSIKTLPLTPDEIATKAQLEQQLIDLQKMPFALAMNPNIDSKKQATLLALNEQAQNTTKALLDSYKRDINITGSNIIQSIVAKQASSISLSTTDVSNIVASQKAIAKTTAENKLSQQLGVAALTPESKSIIDSTIENSSTFTDQKVNDTVNSIKMTQTSTNTLELSAPGNINITNSNITQSIVADMVVKALVSNSFQAGTKVANDFVAEASATIASDGKSAGADALVKELGNANAAAISAAKVSGMSGAIFAVVIVLFLAVGFGAVKSAGSMMMNNAVLIMAIVSIVAGIIYATKSGVGNKILGVIMVVLGVAGLGFGVMLRMRASAMPLQFRFQ